MDDIKKITLDLRRPGRGCPAGETVDGWYVVVENNVVLTDAKGQSIGEKRHLSAGDDPRLVACAMLRQRSRANSGGRPSGFNREIRYPKSGYC